MAYEIDYIGVKADKATKDADAICLRWKTGIALNGMPIYKVGVIDGIMVQLSRQKSEIFIMN